MIKNLTSYLTACLMAVPMCWCCLAQSMPAATAQIEACPACQSLAGETEAPPGKTPGKDCACCMGVLERGLSPEIATAPRSFIVALQAWEWRRTDILPGNPAACGMNPALAAEHNAPPRPREPFYIRHCALLL